MNDNILKRWAWQILAGLVYLHGHDPPIVHRSGLHLFSLAIGSSIGAHPFRPHTVFMLFYICSSSIAPPDSPPLWQAPTHKWGQDLPCADEVPAGKRSHFHPLLRPC